MIYVANMFGGDWTDILVPAFPLFDFYSIIFHST
jgi:hypothetical protein